jgi:hypothetical protein
VPRNGASCANVHSRLISVEKICDEFEEQFSVVFNAAKSKCTLCSANIPARSYLLSEPYPDFILVVMLYNMYMSGHTWATSYMLIVMPPIILCLVGLNPLVELLD